MMARATTSHHEPRATPRWRTRVCLTNLQGRTQARHAPQHLECVCVWGGRVTRTEQAAYLALTDSAFQSKLLHVAHVGRQGLGQSVDATHQVSLGAEPRGQSEEPGPRDNLSGPSPQEL